jgi:(1->4)-alpha-D-glucan 1-alpha-D-glucosylmutase
VVCGMVSSSMTAPRIPVATYRLQFNRNFTFAQATELVPYLAGLGISHCYASPYLRARPGSTHGYDIIDHNVLNPEIGTAEDFERFVAALRKHGMGHILDVVPNHMGVMGSDNAWWLDVLENGEAATYAEFFDIDWQPLKEELQGKVLVAVLGDQYGTILDRGEFELTFDMEKGEFSIFYQQHRFPVDPKEYPRILEGRLERLEERLGARDEDLLELQSLISAFNHLPGRQEVALRHCVHIPLR